MIASSFVPFYKIKSAKWEQKDLQAHVPSVDDPELPARTRAC